MESNVDQVPLGALVFATYRHVFGEALPGPGREALARHRPASYKGRSFLLSLFAVEVGDADDLADDADLVRGDTDACLRTLINRVGMRDWAEEAGVFRDFHDVNLSFNAGGRSYKLNIGLHLWGGAPEHHPLLLVLD